jgi:hypothetical protein
MFNLSVPGPRRRRRLAGAMATAAVTACAVTGCSAISSLAGSAGGTTSAPHSGVLNAAPGVPGAGSPPAVAAPPRPPGPPADPFAGTPADDWADGTAGVTLPAAHAVGGYTRTQVADAYQTTRQLLIAANLDQQTLRGGQPTAFASLLTPGQRTQFLGSLKKVGLDKQDSPLSYRSWLMSFAPGSAELIGHVIKVNGTMHAKVVTDKDGTTELDIDLEYHFVYPIEPPHDPASWMRVVNEVSGSVNFANWVGADSNFAPWVEFGPSAAGILCGSRDGFQHPDYPNDATVAPGVTPTGTLLDPYGVSPTTTDPGTCEASTDT